MHIELDHTDWEYMYMSSLKTLDVEGEIGDQFNACKVLITTNGAEMHCINSCVISIRYEGA